MKRIILFFTVCLGLSVFQTTFANTSDTTRTTSKRASNTTLSTSINTNRSRLSDTKRTTTQQNKTARTTIKTNQKNVVSRTPNTSQNVKSRTATTQPNQNTTKRNPGGSRTTTLRNNEPHKSATTRSAITSKIVRATEINNEKLANIKSANYSKCKTVYYDCMDEFCANKDANLRRCACSSRIHEFDNIKKQLDSAEDKMLDFNQRLLMVSLDKEDAAAINTATEGELAFNTKDMSDSEKLLQKITKTLNTSGDSKINNDLSAISLSLDMDSAWDNIDSLSGISTTSKNGLDLYNAVRPMCVEMAKEVCTDDELTIATDGYKLNIEQDCNTVAKSYNTLYNNAIEKIHESGALLDMSRLNIYQQRNSDDTLTCKKKILTQLSDNAVCGENLYKCLDTTGEYIDPSTGKAFLSENLYNLVNLLQEPTGNEKWSKITKNEPFVKFINSKKEFLKPAIEQCRDISDTIWKEFLDDALSQIKLAQNAKMEEIRQGCTTLVAECKTSALTDLSEFDSRALSIFNVAADKTANEMCSKIQNSCISLMGNNSGDTWGTGMTNIATDITYKSVIDTCTQIGRDCIIQKCNGAAGNFALCKGTNSDNRIAILKRDACWNEVLNCVNSADNLDTMNITETNSNYYDSNACGDDIHHNACLITKQIWGDCERDNTNIMISTLGLSSSVSSNKIIIPDTGSTLLSWLATNTGTNDSVASCNTYPCPVNSQNINGTCQQTISNQTHDCYTANNYNQIIHVTSDLTNYCTNGKRDMFGNCCQDAVHDGICVPGNNYNALLLVTNTCTDQHVYYCPDHNSSNPRRISVYCVTTADYIEYNDSGTGYDVDYVCPNNGKWVLIDQYGNYFDVDGQSNAPAMHYNQQCSNFNNACAGNCNRTSCTYSYTTGGWSFDCNDINVNEIPTNNEFIIEY